MRTLTKLTVLFIFLLAVLLYFWSPQTWVVELLATERPSARLYDEEGPRLLALTYFHSRHVNGEYVDSYHPSYRLRLSDHVSDFSKWSGVNLKVEPALIDNGGLVTVSWSGVKTPGSADWIGLFCPAEVDSHAYLDYVFANTVESHKDGYGKFSVHVYNLRTKCEFRYYTNDTHTTILSRSNQLEFAGGKNTPLQVHLALTGDPTQMRIQWTSGTKKFPTVRFGSTPDELLLIATGVSRTYKNTDMCGPPASSKLHFVDPGYLHDVLLSDLRSSSVYYYQYGTSSAWSGIHNFTTAPSTGSSRPFTFITYGDMGPYQDIGALHTSVQVAREVSEGAELIVHQGDLSYAVGLGYIWDQWMSMIESAASRVPYMVGIGNHEQDHVSGGDKDPSKVAGNGFHPSWGNYGADSGGECGVPVHYRFHMPDNGNGVWWYSFNYASVHFTFISTEHDFTRGSVQYRWLEQDLKSADHHVTPWLVLVGHRPMYTSEKFHGDYIVSLHIRAALEDLLNQHHVNLALWGHRHSYERTCAVYREECVGNGTVHIVIGGAGAELDSVSVSQYDVPWSETLQMKLGYGRITVVNNSALLWEFVLNSDRSVGDHAWITRGKR